MSTPNLPLEPAAWLARQQARQAQALARLDVIESRLQAGGAAWDNATPAQRTMAMREVVSIVRRMLIENLDSDAP